MIEMQVKITNISLTNAYQVANPNPNPNPTPTEGFNITIQPIGIDAPNVPIILYSPTASLNIGEVYTLSIS